MKQIKKNQIKKQFNVIALTDAMQAKLVGGTATATPVKKVCDNPNG
jgi:hypothetical protein